MPLRLASGIGKNDITIIDQDYQSFSKDISPVKIGPSSYTKDSLAFAEVRFSVLGATYQKLLDGMATRAGRGPTSASPFPANVGQVESTATYQFQLGVAFQGFSNRYGAPLVTSWQGDVQVTDAITGQGSMGYAWNGTATVQPTAASLKGVVRKVLGSAATGYGTKTDNSFFQPTTNGTASKVPQQPVAQAYVYDWLAKAVNPT